MAQKAPGKHFREGISLMELFQEFPDNETAMQWFVQARWPDGIRCAYCESENVDLPPTFVPPVMLVRQARGQVRQARGPQALAAGSPENCVV